MSTEKKAVLRAFILAALGCAALRLLPILAPSPVATLLAPARDSVWERSKGVYLTGLVASVCLAKKQGALGEHMLALLIGFSAALSLGFLYAYPLGGRGELIYTLIDLAALALVFWLPGQLEKRLNGALAELWLLLVIALGGAVTLFAYLPPNTPLFAGLSREAWQVVYG